MPSAIPATALGPVDGLVAGLRGGGVSPPFFPSHQKDRTPADVSAVFARFLLWVVAQFLWFWASILELFSQLGRLALIYSGVFRLIERDSD